MSNSTLIIGCGNLLRGDDALGPLLIRRLWTLGLGDHVRLADGGTAGMNVAFDMKGMRHVLIIDACRTGAEPGTLFDIPGEHVETPPLSAVNLHNFRWDHALAFARWLLKDEYPPHVRVLLMEGASYEPGAPLSPIVAAGVDLLAARLRDEYAPFPATNLSFNVELTTAGYLIIDGIDAARFLAAPTVLIDTCDDQIVVTPLHHAAVGGLILKQRNARGDRAVLIKEHLPARAEAGTRRATWDAGACVLRVPLAADQPACTIDSTASTERQHAPV